MIIVMTMTTQVSIPDETVKFSYDQQRQYILFQGTEVIMILMILVVLVILVILVC